MQKIVNFYEVFIFSNIFHHKISKKFITRTKSFIFFSCIDNDELNKDIPLVFPNFNFNLKKKFLSKDFTNKVTYKKFTTR